MNKDDELFRMILGMVGGDFTDIIDKSGAVEIESFMDAFVDKCIEENNQPLIALFKDLYPEKFI